MSALIYQCPACRALVGVDRAELQPTRAGLHCEACGAVAWLPDAQSRSEARVVDVEPTARPTAPRELLPSAGALVVAAPSAPAAPTGEARFGADTLARLRDKLASLPAPTEPQRELATDFEQLLGSWEGEAGHKALLKRASSAGELAFIGQRYRAVLDIVPQDERARRAQGEVLTLAMAAMSATRDLGALAIDPAEKTRRRTLAASLVLFVFAAIILWAVRQRNALLRDDADGAKMLVEDPAGQVAR